MCFPLKLLFYNNLICIRVLKCKKHDKKKKPEFSYYLNQFFFKLLFNLDL